MLLAAIPAKMDGLSFSPEAVAYMERPEVEAQIAREGLDPNRIANSKEDSQIWKIRFAAANIYHIERWRQLRSGRVFYNEKANEAATQSMPERWDFRSRFRKHAYPITIIMGDHDFVDWKAVRWKALGADTPNLGVVVLEKAGHNVWIDQPARFREAVQSALVSIANAE